MGDDGGGAVVRVCEVILGMGCGSESAAVFAECYRVYTGPRKDRES